MYGQAASDDREHGIRRSRIGCSRAMSRPRSHRPCPGSGTAAFHYRDAELYCEDMPLAELAARFGTPLYVYSRAAMAERYAAIRAAFGADAHVCYAVKANPNLAILRTFAQLGA